LNNNKKKKDDKKKDLKKKKNKINNGIRIRPGKVRSDLKL